ncbi:endonuclease V [Methanocella paludicola SANAE]|uniref:Endonuclease V n=1 Tax=Methanocella paludicola (strain DSM 17711 / JCM 13418 / NBRC 101707 / SANAE) TaxID=304371 RepID=D1YYK8_METPS|nr:endonuclease V [Methanocella paludicola]BAI61530.1 endonuclease V [Methanocella paludicola SANAE]
MDVHELYNEQIELSKKAILTDSFPPIKRVGGVDCSYLDDKFIIAGLVVLDYGTLKPIYRTFDIQRLTFPYIPGLLAYREAEAMMGVIKKAKVRPDLIMVDGFGTNHPRRCGIATHIGIKLDVPAIGVGKSFLCGEVQGQRIIQDGEETGRLVRAISGQKPVYVSPGHKISLKTAVKVVKHCMAGHRQPEPTRQAHEYVTSIKNRSLLRENLNRAKNGPR